MKLTLNEILSTSKELVESMSELDQDYTKKFENIVKGVSRKYASIYVDREDLEQELWLLVVSKVNEFGGADKVDPRFIARCCYNKAVDFYRYSRRRKDSTATLLEDAESDDTQSNLSDPLQFSYSDSSYDRVVIHEVIDLFPLESRERKYVVTKLYMYGTISAKDGLPDKLELPEDDTEASILKLLGYNSKYPASWGKMKYQIRDKIYRYLGILSEDENACEASVKSTILKRVEDMVLSSRKGYLSFDKVMRDKALTLLNLNESILKEVISDSDKLLGSVGPTGDWWVLKNDDRIAMKYFIEYGYKVFDRDMA